MYQIFLEGIYKGTFDLEEVVTFLDKNNFFKLYTIKLSLYSDSDKLKAELTNWDIGEGKYLDTNHRWRIVKIR